MGFRDLEVGDERHLINIQISRNYFSVLLSLDKLNLEYKGSRNVKFKSFTRTLLRKVIIGSSSKNLTSHDCRPQVSHIT